MTKKDLAKKVTQYKDLKGKPEAEIRAAITSTEGDNFPPDDLEQLVAELMIVDNAGAGDLPDENAKPNANVEFEEWKVEPDYKDFPAKKGQAAYRELQGFTKLQKIKNVRIAPDRAKLLNEHSEMNKIHYFKVEAKAKK